MSRLTTVKTKDAAQPAVVSGMRSEIVLITPEMAEQWLGSNTNNRNLARSTRTAYARDMKNGKWLLSGDAIRFDLYGNIVDGQHRLAACVEAGVPFESYVIWGLPQDVIRVIDHGRPRTVADNLHIEGHRHALMLAAAARWLYVFKHGSIAIGKGRVTATEILNIVDRHPVLESSCGAAYGCCGVTASLLAAVHYVGGRLIGEEEKADNFASVFTSGQNFYTDDAALVWRERLLRMRQSRAAVAQNFLQCGTIHAWNLFSNEEAAKIGRAPDVVAFDRLDYDLL